jgi:hypothetical protein
MAFEPIANYAGYEHVLNGMPDFVHPQNGNMYGIAIEKVGGVRQDLSVYRTRPGSTQKELVKRYIGGADSRAQIAAGGCQILQDGSLEVWASAVPVTSPPVTKTGFSGVWDRVPGVDAPWSASGGTAPPVGVAVPIPPGSPLASIWTPAYTAAEVDSPDEIAVKFTKNNDQWEQLIALLKQAGVLV